MVMTMVDVRKYAAGAYLKPTDIEGAVIKRIINVEETDGKFGPKLDAWFEDGSRLSLSGKNVGELMRVYGTDSDSWLDKNVELTVKEYEDRDGKPGKMILLTAIDPEVPREERPKLTATSPPREKPPPKTAPPKTVNGNTRADMDDEIPF
jgi:hypothetical protein